jgi:hypothetical protein
MSVQFEDVVGQVISSAPAGSLPRAAPAESETARARAVARTIEREKWRCVRLSDA